MEIIIASIVAIVASIFGSYISSIWAILFKRRTKTSIKLGGKLVNIEIGDIESSVANVREALSYERENPKVFISYASVDKELARKITSYLSSQGIETWLDEQEISPGDSISKKINEGLKSSQWFLQIMSPESSKSEWMHKELSKIIDLEKKRNRNLIIPVLTQSVQLPDEIRDRSYINLEDNYEQNMARLVDAIKFRTEKSSNNAINTDS
ncbi:toll/interleukin-1 receptor domain-containing protein [Halomonas halodenitrificans]|uniref:toll/interleukin-1 receptor domain-containing protein n=1 Tax=Halomonas halodenitrificans TaxID=28252 RepID=UPI0009FC5769|nr:toll/interleukin-1 receptor domain-containing protein [Halomonas halodenitrificans]